MPLRRSFCLPPIHKKILNDVSFNAMSQQLRFVTEAESKSGDVPWGVNEWLCNVDLCAAEKLGLVRVHIPPGAGHSFHRHPFMEEIIYVVEGECEQWVGQEQRTLGPGGMAHIPTNMVHASFNTTDKPLVLLAILSPAKSDDPPTVDVYEEEPWCNLRS